MKSKCENCLREGTKTRRGAKGSTLRRNMVCYPCFWASAHDVRAAKEAAGSGVRSGTVKWFRI